MLSAVYVIYMQMQGVIDLNDHFPASSLASAEPLVALAGLPCCAGARIRRAAASLRKLFGDIMRLTCSDKVLIVLPNIECFKLKIGGGERI